MHEHGLADDILKTVLEQPQRPPDGIPRCISLQVSELGGLAPEALQAALDHVCEHHGLPPIELRVQIVELLGECSQCGEVAEVTAELVCAACGAEAVRLCGGETVIVKSCQYA